MRESFKEKRAFLLGSRIIRAQPPRLLWDLGVRCTKGYEAPPYPLGFRLKDQPLHPENFWMQCSRQILTLTYLFLCRLLASWDISLNPGPPRRQTKNCRVLCANIRGLHGNFKSLTAVSNDYDVILLSEALVGQQRHPVELSVPGFGKPLISPKDGFPSARGMAVYIRAGYPASRLRQYECGCHETMVVRVSGRRVNYYIFGVYRSPNADNGIYDCLISKLHDIQVSDAKSSFVFTGDFNAKHLAWHSQITDDDGRAAFEFGVSSGTSQLVKEQTHSRGNVLDLLFTDVPETVTVKVDDHIGNSDHSALSINIVINQPVLPVVSDRVVYLKKRVDWSSVRHDILQIPWRDVLEAACPVTALSSSLEEIIVNRVPKRTIKVRMKSKPWFDEECQIAKRAKDEAYNFWKRHRSREAYQVLALRRRVAEQVYSQAQKRLYLRQRSSLAQSLDPSKWWSNLKSAVFGPDSCIPPLIDSDGTLLCDSQAKADALSRFFDSKQCRQRVNIPLSCHPEPKLKSIAFRSREVLKILSELDAHGGTDPHGMFPLFLKEVRKELAPKLAIIFRLLIKRGSFPRYWRTADVVPVPKDESCAKVSNNRPISITPILSKIFEKLLSVRLVGYFESCGYLPRCQFAYRKGLGTCDALLKIVHDLQDALDGGSEARLAQLDFSAAFDRVNHEAMLFKLRTSGVGGPMLSIIEQFLSNRTQRVRVDGSYSGHVDIVSGVPQGSVLGPILFVIYTADLFEVVENRLVNYADDSTLYAIVKRPSSRLSVAESLNRDLARISDWCKQWMMKLNPNKTKTLIVSRSRTLTPAHSDLVLEGETLDVSNSLVILGVTLDSKMTFEQHVMNVTSSVARSMGIVRRASKVFGTEDVITTCFRSYCLSRLEYCSSSWWSAAATHLGLLDRIVRRGERLCGRELCNLEHRRRVSSICMLYKIFNNPNHALREVLVPWQQARITRAASFVHGHQLKPVRCRTEQFRRSFVPRVIDEWNGLPGWVFEGGNLQKFKKATNRHLIGQLF